VGKPTPPIEGLIAKIMNAVLVTPSVSWEARSKTNLVSLHLTNYTRTAKAFTLLAPVPEEGEVRAASPRPAAAKGGLLSWKLRIAPMESQDVVLQVAGLESGDLEDLEVFVEGIDPELVSGAEGWDAEEWVRAKESADSANPDPEPDDEGSEPDQERTDDDEGPGGDEAQGEED